VHAECWFVWCDLHRGCPSTYRVAVPQSESCSCRMSTTHKLTDQRSAQLSRTPVIRLSTIHWNITPAKLCRKSAVRVVDALISSLLDKSHCQQSHVIEAAERKLKP